MVEKYYIEGEDREINNISVWPKPIDKKLYSKHNKKWIKPSMWIVQTKNPLTS